MAIRERVSLFNRYRDQRVRRVEPFKTYYIIMEGKMCIRDRPRIAGDDVFLPVANIADIFDIAPETADAGTILRFRNRRVIAKEPRLSLRKVCAAFKARYRRRGDEIEVYY